MIARIVQGFIFFTDFLFKFLDTWGILMNAKDKKFWNSSVPVDFIGSLYRFEWWWPFYFFAGTWCISAWAQKKYNIVLLSGGPDRIPVPSGFSILSSCSGDDPVGHLSLLKLAMLLSIAAVVVESYVLFPYKKFSLEIKMVFIRYFQERVIHVGYIKSFRFFMCIILSAVIWIIYNSIDIYFLEGKKYLCFDHPSGLVAQAIDIFCAPLFFLVIILAILGRLSGDASISGGRVGKK
jgi:hypothetical protein